MSDRWKIGELQEMAARALSRVRYEEPESKRVRAVPDTRTIRYYTTLGLIDPPAEMQGRTAFYGRRHILQLVCIKRLQAAGTSLAEVQAKLAGATDEQLTGWAELDDRFWDLPDPENSSDGPDQLQPAAAVHQPEAATAFWSEPAVPAADLDNRPSYTPSVRIAIAPGAQLELTDIQLNSLTLEKLSLLNPVLDNLCGELKRLGLVIDDATSSTEKPSSQPPATQEGNNENDDA